jgi:hypothetical protein
MRYPWLIAASPGLLAGCANGQSAARVGDTPTARCTDYGENDFAAWQCAKFNAKQMVAHCLTLPGGELAVRQCQQFYARELERPAPPRAIDGPPEPPPRVATGSGTSISAGRFRQRDAIYVKGTLRSEDDEAFARVGSGLSNPIIVFSGPGGAAISAINIGRFIHVHHWDTLVPEGESCMSACALAWLGGAHRYIAGPDSRVGFHAAYRVIGGQALESGVGNAVVGAYLSRLGLSERAIIYVTMSGPDDVQLLTLRDASMLGIQVSILP